jgi:hypothetical protein
MDCIVTKSSFPAGVVAQREQKGGLEGGCGVAKFAAEVDDWWRVRGSGKFLFSARDRRPAYWTECSSSSIEDGFGNADNLGVIAWRVDFELPSNSTNRAFSVK